MYREYHKDSIYIEHSLNMNLSFWTIAAIQNIFTLDFVSFESSAKAQCLSLLATKCIHSK